MITVRAPTNIALIKYWGKANEEQIIPLNSSISLTIDPSELYTETTIRLTQNPGLVVMLNGIETSPTSRMTRVTERISELKGYTGGFEVTTRNTFPTAAGMASSASGFAALVFGLLNVLDVKVDLPSTLARLGSGSA